MEICVLCGGKQKVTEIKGIDNEIIMPEYFVGLFGNNFHPECVSIFIKKLVEIVKNTQEIK